MAGYGANMSKRQKTTGKDDIFDIVPEVADTARSRVVVMHLHAHMPPHTHHGPLVRFLFVSSCTRAALQGVEGVVPYRGSVNGIITQLVGGVSSGVSYVALAPRRTALFSSLLSLLL